MKYNLLALTQTILRSIKGEAVDDISDTQESLDVVDIIKECYYQIVAGLDLPETKNLFELTASGDPAIPTKMSLPDKAYSLEWVHYESSTADDTEENWVPIQPLTLQDFLAITNPLNTAEDSVASQVITQDNQTFTFKYRSDTAPRYYTTLDDSTIIFDSYDAGVDTTLQSTKTQAYGIYLTDWETTNTFIPKLDAHQFSLLIKEAKAMAWQELKSIDNNAATKSARRLHISSQAKKNRVNQKGLGYYYDQYPNYSRKG